MKYENKDLLDLYKLKAEEHWHTMFNPMLKYLGNLEGKRILDIGCGSGELTNKMAETAGQVTGLDLSPKWIEYCKISYQRKNLSFVQGSATDLKMFPDDYFDIIIMNLVLPNIYKVADMEKIFLEIKRVTRISGEFIFSDVHPILKMTKKEGARRQEYSKGFSYFKEGSKLSVIVALPNKKEIEFEDAHWSLSFYSDLIEKYGFGLVKIIESNYPKNAPKKFFRYSFPEYITFCCKKLK